MKQNITEFYAKDKSAWRMWLHKNHESEQSVWLVYDKGSARTMTYAEIAEEALCYGWIDGVAGTKDESRSKLYISRRKPRSVWSKINKERVERLTAQGLIQPAGFHVIQSAKSNGSWDALTRSDNLELPVELMQQFKKNKAAQANFKKFPPSTKKVILEWIYGAKRDETTQKRIAETVRQAAQGTRAH